MKNLIFFILTFIKFKKIKHWHLTKINFNKKAIAFE